MQCLVRSVFRDLGLLCMFVAFVRNDRAQASISAEVINCNMRYVIAFASRSIDSTSSSNCFKLYVNTFYQYEHVLISTIYIRAFGGYIMAIWPVAFIEICGSDPTFLCSRSIWMDITVL